MSAAPHSGQAKAYRGRLAPSPTGLLHLGHARTFRMAARRAAQAGGVLIYRDEDLDGPRCKPEFSAAALEDLARIGINWSEGPDLGGPCGPYRQSERHAIYRDYWRALCASGWIYPCEYSRKKIREAIARYSGAAGDDSDSEPVFPATLRPEAMRSGDFQRRNPFAGATEPGDVNWRFRVPDGEDVEFLDALQGRQAYRAGRDFGDFLVWRKDGLPAYEFAVVVDDYLMAITEVVRGADLLISTARQLLIYRALGWTPPEFYHCDLVRDKDGRRLAKRHNSVSIRSLLEAGRSIDFFD
jgi:glutamyl/glutaminyl-tRNA synthetase